jgi:uncharacterized membrane protein YphA (DoxX/SURF4 family)
MRDRIREAAANEWLVLVSRLALGGIFLASSVGKLQHPFLFTETVKDYGILPDGLAQFYGTALPWAELFIGCSLVLGIWPRFSAALSVPLAVSFSIAAFYSLFQPGIDVCGCFGELVALSHPQAIAVDFAMLLLASEVLVHGNRAETFGIGRLLSRHDLGLKGRDALALRLAVLSLAIVLAASLIGDSRSPLEKQLAGRPGFLLLYNCAECCQRQIEIIDSLEPEYGHRIAFIRINYVEDPQAAEQFDVDNPFTMLLISGKTEEDEYVIWERFVGTIGKDMLRDAFDELLADASP